MLPRGRSAIVESVEALPDTPPAQDPIAARLRELGFVPGEAVSVLATSPSLLGRLFGQREHATLAVQIGFTRFALRRSEAARVRISLPAA
ncbi:MAG: FeoA domain-containing protein [Rhodocyclaceae bacterium]